MHVFAAVDIGSNSVRLKIARLSAGRLHEIHEDREVTRLGEAVFHNGILSPDAMAATVKVLRRFHRAVQKAGADTVRVVATSATRDARNSHAFLEWVRSATGWNVEIISGIEEARLIHLGIVSSIRVSLSPVLMIDLGGGSCELTISEKAHIKDTVSLPLGAVRLTNDFLRHDPPRNAELSQLHGFIDREIRRISKRITRARPKLVIATSGTAAALAEACHTLYKTSASRATSVSDQQMRRIADSLATLSMEGRKKIHGIGPKRAEIIIAGAAVYAELLDRCQLSGFRYVPLGLRDGILAQMAANADRSTKSQKQIEAERRDSILAAVKHYGVDKEHAQRVRDSALHLFDALKAVHRLPPEYREWLGAAAMLYEVGDYVNRSGRHRHAHYIISHSEILGYTPAQRSIIGAVARYLGKSRPGPTDPAIKLLPLVDQEHVRKASLLLRLARAINLARGPAVQIAGATTRNGEVKLTLKSKPGAGLDLELWATEREVSYFREVFGRELSVASA